MLRKPDQVRCVLLCARLFWRDHVGPVAEYRRPRELQQCLQKTLHIVDKCMPPQPALFVDIFDAFVYFFDRGVPTITPSNISDLVSLCAEQLEAMRAGGDRDAAQAFLGNLLAHVQGQKAKGAGSYADVRV
jgi:vacuolar protein sorting-associated protein 35